MSISLINCIIALNFLFISIVSFYLFRRAIGTLNLLKPTPYLYAFYISILIQAFLSIHILYFVRINSVSLMHVQDSTYILSIFIVSYSIVCIPLSMILVSKILKFYPAVELNRYLSTPTTTLMHPNDTPVFHIILISVIFVTASSLISIQDAPILSLHESPQQLAIMRVDYSLRYEGSKLLKNIISTSFSKLLSYITLCYSLVTRDKRWYLLFIISFLCSTIMQASSLAKAPVALYFFSFLFVYFYVRAKMSIKYITFFIIISLILLLIFYVLTEATILPHSYQYIFGSEENILTRGIFGQIIGLPNYLEIFPRLHPYLLGSELQILRFLGFNSDTSARIAMLYSFRGDGAGVQNTFFQGSAYANFGFLGVALAPIWVGAVLQVFNYVLLRLPKNPLFIGWGVFVLYTLANCINGGFLNEFIFNTTIIAVSLFTFIIYIFTLSVSKNSKYKLYHTKLRSY